jgi:hypothetical protein
VRQVTAALGAEAGFGRAAVFEYEYEYDDEYDMRGN